MAAAGRCVGPSTPTGRVEFGLPALSGLSDTDTHTPPCKIHKGYTRCIFLDLDEVSYRGASNLQRRADPR